VDAVGLPQGGGVGALAAVGEPVQVSRARPNAFDGGREISLAVCLQGGGRAVDDAH